MKDDGLISAFSKRYFPSVDKSTTLTITSYNEYRLLCRLTAKGLKQSSKLRVQIFGVNYAKLAGDFSI